VPAVTLPIGAERRSAGERATVLEVSGIVYLDARHDRGVKRPARKAKTSETEVIRRAIDACERGEMEVAATQRRRVWTQQWPDSSEPSLRSLRARLFV
jgi:hypothetical protein